ncbi:hypothetical protein [Candidatus Nitrospira neomarina]|uniref:Lipoprotein n=1 Tax=Candidatus Nitrospira neomarina TaxID=3020899 RepID=A0AA96GGG2_9BACT|nr:hypothetical protein [Candidatus Nitrospira neomarina]WNM61341.1 hypothetical protein PQG83_16510 [Candidatus Nitrospira neomarina]
MSDLGCRHMRNLIVLLAFGISLGCAGGPNGNEAYKKEGFQVTQPSPGTKVVVRGNHVAAVNQALDWLNDHQLLVVNRQVVQEEGGPEFASRKGTEGQAQALGGARKVGATLVVFVHVNETSLNSTIEPVSGGSPPMNKVVVDILGMNAGAGEVAFEGKAWSSDPVVVSERVIQDLTILALEQAWQKPVSSPSPSQEVNAESPSESPAPQMAPVAPQMAPVAVDPSSSPATTQSATVPLDSPNAGAATQSEPGPPTEMAQEQVTLLTEPVAEEVTPASDVAAPVVAENSENSDDSSLGLQVASGALSILYTPFKVVYAGVGGLFGGFVYLLTGGNEPAAQSIWDASLKGTYYLTPDHLQGNEPVRFKGEAAH